VLVGGTPRARTRPANTGSAGLFSTELGPVFANLLLADEINRASAKV
jgi:MoxR-like ATPase